MASTRVLKLALLISLFLFVSSACTLGPGNLAINQASDLGRRELRRIAILPVDAPPVSREPATPLASAQAVKARAAERAAGSIMTALLYRTVSGLQPWQLVSEREVKEVEPGISGEGGQAERARKLGELVYADAVLFGRVLHFRERVGEELGVESPASVSFVLYLLDVKRGDIVWSARFDETQRALTEDVLAVGKFAQRGARWLTAEELAQEGVRDALESLSQAMRRETEPPLISPSSSAPVPQGE